MDKTFKDDLHQEALKICAGLAYRDLCRTIRNFDKNKSDKEIAAFRDEMYGMIIKWIVDEIFPSSTKPDFDNKHKKICERIKSYAEKSGLFKEDERGKIFCLGQAQKWLNMTLKNILLFNLYPNRMTDVLVEALHIPVDSVIIKLAWELGGVDFPLKVAEPHIISRGKNKGRIRLEDIESWSQWDDWGKYLRFQETLKDGIRSLREYELRPPIEWEFYKWKEAKNSQIF